MHPRRTAPPLGAMWVDLDLGCEVSTWTWTGGNSINYLTSLHKVRHPLGDFLIPTNIAAKYHISQLFDPQNSFDITATMPTPIDQAMNSRVCFMT